MFLSFPWVYKWAITFIRPQSLRTNTRCYITRYFGPTMEKFLNKPAFFKATLPASTKPADLDKERSNLQRMNDDLEQASSQAWQDAKRAAERMLAKRAAPSDGSIPASVVNVPVVPQPTGNVPVVPQPTGNKTLAKEKPDRVANIPVKPLPVTGG